MRGITVPVHLHFDHSAIVCSVNSQGESVRAGRWPYGVAAVDGLVTKQKYDVVVEMEVPRSESNIKAGNWMVGLDIRGPMTVGGGAKGMVEGAKEMIDWEEEWDVEVHTQVAGANQVAEASPEKPHVLAKSRRSALLTYRSQPTELAHQLLRLPLYLIGWHTESERIQIPMMEAVEFSKDARDTPSSIRLELRSRYPIDVYRVRVHIVAKLEGLRRFMYQYQLTSLIVFTTMFWSVEMGVVLITWIMFTLLFGQSPTVEDYEKIKSNGVGMIKKEGDTEPGTPISDTSHTFPTLSSQQPLHYSSPTEGKIKREGRTPSLDDIPTKEDVEADDEDDDFILEEPVPRRESGFEDSGIGTSFESGIERERELQRRRSGRGRVKEESDR